ncbi:MAG: filament integrity protein FraC [Cyanobacteria bacterium P01_A01_bin.105]
MNEFEPVFPLKAVAFQVMFLLIAIAIEGNVLRQRLRLGYQTSIQYATTINLMSTVVGWFSFLAIERFVDVGTRAQIISYIMFDRLITNGLWPRMEWMILTAGLTAFFVALVVKLKGLELLMRMTGRWSMPEKAEDLARADKYDRARTGSNLYQRASNHITSAVLQANALSFTAVLILLVLRSYLIAAEGRV